MRLLEVASDGGKDSGVTGFFIIELKWLFSIVILHFPKGTREAYHSHAFSALTVWLKGSVKEHLFIGHTLGWQAGRIKYTPRNTFHKVEGLDDGAWALSFRGPWADRWQEFRGGQLVTLTHGRKVVC